MGFVFLELNKPNGDLETSTDTGYSSNSGGKSSAWTENSTKPPDEGLTHFSSKSNSSLTIVESTVDYDDQEQVTAV